MKCVLFLISVLLLSVVANTRSLNLKQEKSLSFMKIKESIKSLKGGAGRAGWGAYERCFKYGRKGRYSVDVAYYQSESNTAVKGNYLNLDKKVRALKNDPDLTKTYYTFDCSHPDFKDTGLCRDIAKNKKTMCTKCFGTNKKYMEKKVQMMYGGTLSQKDENRDGNMKITLTVKCQITRRAGYARYTYVVEDPTRRRRLLTKSRREGDCRL